jgi:peroxiredoxin (alkyl hydroperoxide reductase subunit C)
LVQYTFAVNPQEFPAYSNEEAFMAVLVGKQAPDFLADAVVNGEFKQLRLSDFRGKYVVLFFYPLDFTFVCPTELHAFQSKVADFKKHNTEVIGVSVDSKFSHFAWLNTSVNEGGIAGVKYPLVSDITKSIARDYDVLIADAGIALRGTFLIDRSGIVQSQMINNLPLGRSIEEAYRLVTALQFTEEHGDVCPAGWEEGKKAMTPDQAGLKAFFAK